MTTPTRTAALASALLGSALALTLAYLERALQVQPAWIFDVACCAAPWYTRRAQHSTGDHNMPQTTYRLPADFADQLARHGLSVRSFCTAHDIPYRTILAILNPQDHPDRRGGMYATTAWRIARGWAHVFGATEDAAFAELFGERTDAPPSPQVAAPPPSPEAPPHPLPSPLPPDYDQGESRCSAAGAPLSYLGPGDAWALGTVGPMTWAEVRNVLARMEQGRAEERRAEETDEHAHPPPAAPLSLAQAVARRAAANKR